MKEGKGTTILLLENNSAISKARKNILEKNDYNVILTHRGEEALQYCDGQEKTDMVLMDLNLNISTKSGTVAEKIFQNQEIPILFLYTDNEQAAIKKTENIPAYGYLHQKAEEWVLLASVKTAFRLFESKMLEQKREQALIENEIKTRSIFNAISDPVFLHPFREVGFGKFIDVNETAIEKFGYTREELLNLKASEISLTFEKEDHRGNDNPGAPKEFIYETILITKQGEHIPVEITSKVISLKGQSTILSVIKDINEQKKSEKLLLRAKQDYEAIFNGMIETAWIIDYSGNIVDVNSAASNLLGYTKEELIEIGLPGIDTNLSPKEIHGLVSSMPKDKLQIFETTHQKKNGEAFPVEIFSSLITYQGKGAILSVARDITERKWAEKEIKKQLTEKEYLLKAIHHRTKNNIALIASLISLHMKSISNPEAYSILQDTIGRVDCMNVLYDTLLTADNYDNLSVKTYCEKIINSVLAIFPDSPKIKVLRNIDDFIVEQKILFPLGVIIEELLTNIFKYAFPKPQYSLIRFSLKKSGKKVVLMLQDNGVGFPENFDFENSDSFGLTIIKMLSKQLNGDFTIENNSGTKCVLSFPIK
jgi:PAS domain S-box-containing protein